MRYEHTERKNYRESHRDRGEAGRKVQKEGDTCMETLRESGVWREAHRDRGMVREKTDLKRDKKVQTKGKTVK
jgi:hypothetical protein